MGGGYGVVSDVVVRWFVQKFIAELTYIQALVITCEVAVDQIRILTLGPL